MAPEIEAIVGELAAEGYTEFSLEDSCNIYRNGKENLQQNQRLTELRETFV